MQFGHIQTNSDMKHTKIMFAIALAGLFTFTSDLTAAGDGEKKAKGDRAKQQRGDKAQKGQRGGMAAMMKELGITKEQEAKLKEARGKIRNASDKRAAMKQFQAELKEILTEEQFKKMQELRAKQGGKGKRPEGGQKKERKPKN